jgi:hypothetical protein
MMERDEAEYVLFLDADVILYTQPGHDPVNKLIAEMLAQSPPRDIAFGNEDWDGRHDMAW